MGASGRWAPERQWRLAGILLPLLPLKLPLSSLEASQGNFPTHTLNVALRAFWGI